jgi:hypothetical protein
MNDRPKDAMREFERDMRYGQERLAEIRREVGWPTNDDDYERVTPDLQDAYISALESAVVGGSAAMKLIGRTMGRP